MYKAVFLDLDGTLLDDKKNISQENYDAIEYVTKNNGLVIICSGRSISSTQKIWNKIKASKYIIYSNGAGIYDIHKNENIFSSSIDKDICLNLYNYSIQKNICIRFDTPYGRYITDMKFSTSTDILFNENINKFLNENEILQISCMNEEQNHIESCINFINNSFNSIKIENYYNDFYGNDKINTYVINVINPSTSKGNAISGLCKFLKIDINDVIAMGDDLNDISMIKMVGLGVAMGNAKPEVKNIAKEITTTNNDNGVAKILREKFNFI